MKAVAGLLLLLPLCHGVETSCDGRQDNTKCYRALGGSVSIQLVTDASKILKFEWLRYNSLILRWFNGSYVVNYLESRSVITHWTIRIDDLNRDDAGEYQLHIFNSDGRRTGVRILQLIIQAPVSSVRLNSECLSQGEVRVSCSSERGDSPQYSWSLNGTQYFPGSDKSSITLERGVFGRLLCSVSNKISTASKAETISFCGVKTSCDGRQNNTKCYGALGGSVSIQLMNNTAPVFIFVWWKDRSKILELYEGYYEVNELKSRSVITDSNGTIRINDLNRDDAGEHKLHVYNSDGTRTELWILQLIIQAPVSSVRLNSECLSQGEMRVSCSAEGGDSPQYSWSLNGVTLNDTQYSSGNDKSSITLERGDSGRLLCSVSNNISTASKAENIPSCVFINCTLYNGTHMSEWVKEGPDKPQCYVQTTTTATTSPTEGKETDTTVSNKPSTNITTSSQTSFNTDPPWYIMTPDKLPVMVGILSALVFLLVVATVFVCVHKKRKSNKDQAEEDEQELTYADVKILKVRQVQQQRPEEEVEYGQIKISSRPRQPADPTGDDCVYAKVRQAT